MRRHLNGLTREKIYEIASATSENTHPKDASLASDLSESVQVKTTAEDSLKTYLDEGKNRFQEICIEHALNLPEHGVWEVALQLNNVPTHSANREFLNLLSSSNPGLTGRPVWLDSRGFTNRESHPVVHKEVWKAFIVSWEIIGVITLIP